MSKIIKIGFVLLLCSVSTIIYAQNVGINTTGASPSANAILDLNTGNTLQNLGFIVPNVSLTALGTFKPPIANAATGGDVGMLVYNTNNAVGSGVGYYCWTGATWVPLTPINHGMVTFPANGTIMSWTVPIGITSITITIAGGGGGVDPTYTTGGAGAVFTQTFTINSGDVLKLAPGMRGEIYGGGGGSFIYDNTTSILLGAAGGGGGGGYTAGNNGSAGSTTLSPTAGGAGSGAGGTGGAGSSGGGAGTGSGSGAGGAGWGENGTSLSPAIGGNDWANLLVSAAGYNGDFGGFGGGGGGGHYGGGGGGGYNGGGGGGGSSNSGGGGGGSGYYNGVTFVQPTTAVATNTGSGSILIQY